MFYFFKSAQVYFMEPSNSKPFLISDISKIRLFLLIVNIHCFVILKVSQYFCDISL